jgi:hypothetical protein
MGLKGDLVPPLIYKRSGYVEELVDPIFGTIFSQRFE